jgi:hypothetical protein
MSKKRYTHEQILRKLKSTEGGDDRVGGTQ